MSITQAIILCAGLFIIIFATGFWVKKLGKPYPVIVLNLHKLIALAAVVYLAVTFIKIQKVDPLTSAQIAGLVVNAFLVVLTVISGGLASLTKPVAETFLRIHRVSPYLTLLATAASLYFLL